MAKSVLWINEVADIGRRMHAYLTEKYSGQIHFYELYTGDLTFSGIDRFLRLLHESSLSQPPVDVIVMNITSQSVDDLFDLSKVDVKRNQFRQELDSIHLVDGRSLSTIPILTIMEAFGGQARRNIVGNLHHQNYATDLRYLAESLEVLLYESKENLIRQVEPIGIALVLEEELIEPFFLAKHIHFEGHDESACFSDSREANRRSPHQLGDGIY